MTQTRTNLVGLSRDELIEVLAKIEEKPFRAKQLWHWMYHRGISDFNDMSNLGKWLC